MRCNSVFYALSSSTIKQECILCQQATELRIRIEFIFTGPWKGWGTLVAVSIPLLMFRAHWPCLSSAATPLIQKHKRQTWEKNQRGFYCISKHNLQLLWERVLPRRMAPPGWTERIWPHGLCLKLCRGQVIMLRREKHHFLMTGASSSPNRALGQAEEKKKKNLWVIVFQANEPPSHCWRQRTICLEHQQAPATWFPTKGNHPIISCSI